MSRPINEQRTNMGTWILPRQLHTLASALDTAALSLDSNEQSQVCAQSLFVRSKPSPLAIWLRKWKRDSWTRHLSGRILRPSLGQRFATEWTSSLGATHASPSVQQANVEAKTIQGTSGPTSQTAFDFSDLGSASLRTSKDISAWGCPTSSKTWQEWVIEQRGAYSARLNAVRHTSGNGCSFSQWPTTAARDWKGCGNAVDRKDGKHRLDTLEAVVIHGPPAPASSSTDGSRPGLSEVATRDGNWTTPAATDTGRTTQYQQGGKALSMQVWQTATVSTGAHKQKDGSMIDKLDQQVKSWATPDVSDRRSNNCRQIGLSNQTQGKLNPRWVETLMGLPVGWTMPSCVSPVTIERMNSDYSETGSSQQPPL